MRVPRDLPQSAPCACFESAGDDAELVLARPWLEVSSNEIAAYVKRAKLTWVEDDSNADTRFLRNLIRNDILPPLDAARKGWRSAAARSITLVAQSAEILSNLGEDDCAHCAGDKPGSLNIAKLLNLGFERQANCLRAWLGMSGVRSPSHAKLSEILRQLRQTHADTKMSFRHRRQRTPPLGRQSCNGRSCNDTARRRTFDADRMERRRERRSRPVVRHSEVCPLPRR